MYILDDILFIIIYPPYKNCKAIFAHMPPLLIDVKPCILGCPGMLGVTFCNIYEPYYPIRNVKFDLWAREFDNFKTCNS